MLMNIKRLSIFDEYPDIAQSENTPYIAAGYVFLVEVLVGVLVVAGVIGC